MSGKDRRKALLELAKLRGAKGTDSSSSTTDPIAASPLSVAPAEGPEPGRKRRKLVKAFPSSAAAAAPAPSTEEESSGSPLIHRKRTLPAVGGASSLQPGEIEVVEIEEGSPSPLSIQPAPVPSCSLSPKQLPSPTPRSPSPPPAGQPLGQSTPPARGDSARSGDLPGPLVSPPSLPTSAATAEGGGTSSRPSGSGTSNENFNRVIAPGEADCAFLGIFHPAPQANSPGEEGKGA
ncbi:uncharacterized protein [Phaseolus vulgaris]|uniref:uncharacterized protein n=1 Tax=Phaseolus vulgaris TaxID=3885 RepID=UPI0035CC885F